MAGDEEAKPDLFICISSSLLLYKKTGYMGYNSNDTAYVMRRVPFCNTERMFDRHIFATFIGRTTILY